MVAIKQMGGRVRHQPCRTAIRLGALGSWHGRAKMLALLITASSAAGAGAGPLPLKLVRDVPLPGGSTRFDYQALDPTNDRLYIAHLGADSVVIFNLRGDSVVGQIARLPSVHGVVAAPDRHLLFATITGEKKLAIIDDQSLAIRARVPAGEYPNGLAFDPKTNRVFVSNNSGIGVAVVDVNESKPLPGIDVGGGAGNTQYDPASAHVFVTVHNAAALVEIDPVAMKVVTRHSLKGVKTCHGLLVANEPRLAFAACWGDRGPSLVTFDLAEMRQVSTHSVPPQVDVLAFDATGRRLYVSSSTGKVAVFDVATDHQLVEIGEGFVGPNAHTVSVDPRTHRVYFPLENLNGRAVLRIMEPTSPFFSSPQ
jgi:DNA-binding beta-propeller fold protein YncE